MGLVWRVCEPDDLLPEARRHAELLAGRPISSLVAVKRTMTAPLRAEIAAARERENAAFAELMGGPANLEALTAFAEGRPPTSRRCRPAGDVGLIVRLGGLSVAFVPGRDVSFGNHGRTRERVSSEHPDTERRARLDHETVVVAAEGIVDREGYDALSMTLLAAELDSRVSSLYNHVANLEDLRAEMQVRAMTLLGRHVQRAAMGRAGADGLRVLSHQLRDFARTYPQRYAAITRAPIDRDGLLRRRGRGDRGDGRHGALHGSA